MKNLKPIQVAALVNGILKGASGRAANVQANAPLPWGANVLPAGLYEFQYTNIDPNTHQGGTFQALRAVVYFCKAGVKAPIPVGSETYVSRTPCKHDPS
jgi:hypothetical protein